MAWVETMDGAINLERVDSLFASKYDDRSIKAGGMTCVARPIARVTAMQNGERHHIIEFTVTPGDIATSETMCRRVIQYLASLATGTLYIKRTDIEKMLEGYK